MERSQGELFDDRGEQFETVAEAMERFCRDAWHGDRPALRGFSLEMLRGEDDSRPAMPYGRLNAAA